jgi:hypothetical protein
MNQQEPELRLNKEQMVVYSIHIREVLDAIPTKFDKPRVDPVDLLLYMAMVDLGNLATHMVALTRSLYE